MYPEDANWEQIRDEVGFKANTAERVGVAGLRTQDKINYLAYERVSEPNTPLELTVPSTVLEWRNLVDTIEPTTKSLMIEVPDVSAASILLENIPTKSFPFVYIKFNFIGNIYPSGTTGLNVDMTHYGKVILDFTFGTAWSTPALCIINCNSVEITSNVGSVPVHPCLRLRAFRVDGIFQSDYFTIEVPLSEFLRHEGLQSFGALYSKRSCYAFNGVNEHNDLVGKTLVYSGRDSCCVIEQDLTSFSDDYIFVSWKRGQGYGAFTVLLDSDTFFPNINYSNDHCRKFTTQVSTRILGRLTDRVINDSTVRFDEMRWGYLPNGVCIALWRDKILFEDSAVVDGYFPVNIGNFPGQSQLYIGDGDLDQSLPVLAAGSQRSYSAVNEGGVIRYDRKLVRCYAPANTSGAVFRAAEIGELRYSVGCPSGTIENADRVVVERLDMSQPVSLPAFNVVGELQFIDVYLDMGSRLECSCDVLIMDSEGTTLSTGNTAVSQALTMGANYLNNAGCLKIYVRERCNVTRNFLYGVWIEMEVNSWVRQYLSSSRTKMEGVYAYTEDIAGLMPEYFDESLQLNYPHVEGCLFLNGLLNRQRNVCLPLELLVELGGIHTFFATHSLFLGGVNRPACIDTTKSYCENDLYFRLLDSQSITYLGIENDLDGIALDPNGVLAVKVDFPFPPDVSHTVQVFPLFGYANRGVVSPTDSEDLLSMFDIMTIRNHTTFGAVSGADRSILRLPMEGINLKRVYYKDYFAAVLLPMTSYPGSYLTDVHSHIKDNNLHGIISDDPNPTPL